MILVKQRLSRRRMSTAALPSSRLRSGWAAAGCSSACGGAVEPTRIMMSKGVFAQLMPAVRAIDGAPVRGHSHTPAAVAKAAQPQRSDPILTMGGHWGARLPSAHPSRMCFSLPSVQAAYAAAQAGSHPIPTRAESESVVSTPMPMLNAVSVAVPMATPRGLHGCVTRSAPILNWCLQAPLRQQLHKLRPPVQVLPVRGRLRRQKAARLPRSWPSPDRVPPRGWLLRFRRPGSAVSVHYSHVGGRRLLHRLPRGISIRTHAWKVHRRKYHNFRNS